MNTTRITSLTFTILGVLILIAAVLGNAAWVIRADSPAPGIPVTHESMSGVDTLVVDGAGAHVAIEFGDVDFPSLDVSTVGTTDDWEYFVDDNALVVTSRSSPCIGWCRSGEAYVRLTLPDDLDGSLAAVFDVEAGTFEASGGFTDLSVELAGGAADIALMGTPPTAVELDVSGGTVDLSLPDQPYAVTVDGFVNNLLTSDPRADATVDVASHSASVTLRPN